MTARHTRRHVLQTGAFSLGGMGLIHLLAQDGLLAAPGPAKPDLEPVVYDLKPKPPHFAAKAKAMISLFLVGGPSQIDLFDPKPTLLKYDGRDYPDDNLVFDNPAGSNKRVMASPWKFQRYGQCGMELSELLPHIGGVADDLLLIRSMHSPVNNHVPGIYALNCGKGVSGRPAMGSWLTYALGSESQELPAFVALTDPRGLPLLGGENWSNGWLPSLYQGTVARPKDPRILNLDPPPHLRGQPQAEQLALLARLNAAHLAARPGETDLAARIASYELAGRMQLAAKEAFDLSQETQETRELYGVDDPITQSWGTRCLIARRLVERGVRFVQLWSNGQNWDHHHGIYLRLPERCREVDRPTAALITDLKRRGLLDTTIVHWGGEMGRLPVIQAAGDTSRDKVGRDHNTFGFSQLVAGGGFKAGAVHGATDDFAHHAVEDKVSNSDWLATVFHLFGLDHEKLVFKQGAKTLSLTDGQGTVQQKLFA